MALRIRVNSLDLLFAKYIRSRDKVCQRCGRSDRQLNCAHWNRKINNLRYDELSCFALCCFPCHKGPTGVDENRNIKEALWREWMGEEGFALMEGRERIHLKITDNDRIVLKKVFEEKIKELEAKTI